MRLYPEQTANRNVPKDVFLVAELSAMSGEITTTFYIDYAGNLLKVGDWVMDKPRPSSFSEMCRATGDAEQMIEFRWRSHFRLQSEL